MGKYLFRTDEFGVSGDGIHLLRSGFHYETIHWRHINSVRIERGKELHNWWIISILGLALLVVGCYLTVRTVDILMHKEHAERYVKMLLFFLTPCIGVYFVYNSLKTGIVLSINYATNKKEMFPLRKIIKEDRLNEFRFYLADKLRKTNSEYTPPGS